MEIFSQTLGWIGTLLVISAYYLVSHKKISSSSEVYQIMNLVGAVGVGIGAFYKGSWPSFTLQIAWAIIAISALIKIKRE